MVIKTKETQVSNSESFADILRCILNAEDMVDRDKEHFWVMGLDSKNRIKYVELVSLGNLNASIVSPREVFRRAILEGASSIIVGHNHPSGDPTPSSEDMNITNKLTEGGDLLGISLLDHVVIGNDSETFQSIKEE